MGAHAEDDPPGRADGPAAPIVYDTTRALKPGAGVRDGEGGGRAGGGPRADAEDGGARTPPVARIGRYQLGALLGQGGMGVVYRARDPELDRDRKSTRLNSSHAIPSRMPSSA